MRNISLAGLFVLLAAGSPLAHGDDPCDDLGDPLYYCGTAPQVEYSNGRVHLRFDPVQEILCYYVMATTPAPGINVPGDEDSLTIPEKQPAVATFFGDPAGPDRIVFSDTVAVGGKTVQVDGDILLEDWDRGVVDVDISDAGPGVRYLMRAAKPCDPAITLEAGLHPDPGEACNLVVLDTPLLFCTGESHQVTLCLYASEGVGQGTFNGSWKVTGGGDFYSATPAEGEFEDLMTGDYLPQTITLTNLEFHPADQPKTITVEIEAVFHSWNDHCCCIMDPVTVSMHATTQSAQCSLGDQEFFEDDPTQPVEMTITNPCDVALTGTWEITGHPDLYDTPHQGAFNIPPYGELKQNVMITSLEGHGPPVELTLTVTPNELGSCTAMGKMTYEPPKIESICATYNRKGCEGENDQWAFYLFDVTVNETFEVTVDWRSHEPGEVQFITAHDTYVVATSGDTAEEDFDMADDEDFPLGSRLKVKAKSSDGSESDEQEANLRIIPPPVPLMVPMFHVPTRLNKELKYQHRVKVAPWDESIPAEEFGKQVPLQGGQKWEWKPELDLEFKLSGTKKNATAKLVLPGAALDLVKMPTTFGLSFSIRPGFEAAWKLIGTPDGDAWRFVDAPREWPRAGEEIAWAFAGGKIIFQASVSFAVPPVPVTWVSPVPIGPFVIPVPMYAQGTVALMFNAEYGISDWTDGVDLMDLTAAWTYSPRGEGYIGVGRPGIIGLEAFVGGGSDMGLQWPADPESGRFTKFDLVFGGGLRFRLWVYSFNLAAVECKWALICDPEVSDCFDCDWVGAGGFDRLEWEVLDRSYLWDDRGFAVFHGGDEWLGRGSGRTVETTLVSNEFRDATPDLTQSSDSLLLTWLTDDAKRDDRNRTMAVYSRSDGETWSEPAPIADDGTADFNPLIVGTGDGNALATWTDRITAGRPDAGVMEMSEELEIAVAAYDAGSDAWGPEITLTDNDYLDHSPRLAVADDGTALVAWVANEASHVWGTPTEPNDIMYSTFDGVAWSPVAVATTGIPSTLTLDVAYDGTAAVLLYSADVDGDMTTLEDSEIFALTFDGSVWSAPFQVTDDGAELITDTTPHPIYDAAGDLLFLWVRDGSIVSARSFDLSDLATVVERPGGRTGIVQFDLARNDDGRIALVWPDASVDLADIRYSFLDPSEDLWTEARKLLADRDIERDITAAFDPAGNLALAYSKVALTSVPQDIWFQEQWYTVDVPQPESDTADLNLLEHVFATDLGITPDDIALDPANPLPGEETTIFATVANLGDLTATNVDVAFYDGDPDASGTQIGATQTLTEPFAGGTTAQAQVAWTVPESAEPREVFVVVDPDLEQPDIDFLNNTAGRVVLAPDLLIDEMWLEQPTPCTHQISLTVWNNSPVASGPFSVKLREHALDGELLTTFDDTGLPADAVAEFTYLWETPDTDTGGEILMYAIVDEDDEVTEFYEVNNDEIALIDLNIGDGPDCNENGILDECDLLYGVSQDCNGNGIPDECDIADGISLDCQPNGVPDECDLADGTSADCNENGVPDECDIAAGTSQDCQPNGVPDECDIAEGTSEDLDEDGIPDECQQPPLPGDLNCDGTVGFFDIEPFIEALGGRDPYDAAYPGCHWLNGDCNGDGTVDFFDIGAFVDLLGG